MTVTFAAYTGFVLPLSSFVKVDRQMSKKCQTTPGSACGFIDLRALTAMSQPPEAALKVELAEASPLQPPFNR
ncbi:hypothetical protein RRH01S_07_02540 [Rhizobium rhizogenes NBRC 13257]|uniref:Uncharacterized protein n=1 Tax=Rhizobium rhizogenes NBRC 13257 TaxID=1220581 RepID=A0AA87Q4W2_RHIRH|nr:hypothetical protein RRH01S_07_02540 [Rhizobium rhizogenes NBRC 13257]